VVVTLVIMIGVVVIVIVCGLARAGANGARARSAALRGGRAAATRLLTRRRRLELVGS
jgi:hypothetical protein